MAATFPALEPQLLSITARLVDLPAIVRKHVYHPEFDGSFSSQKNFTGARAGAQL
jgi:hypothetical protein